MSLFKGGGKEKEKWGDPHTKRRAGAIISAFLIHRLRRGKKGRGGGRKGGKGKKDDGFIILSSLADRTQTTISFRVRERKRKKRGKRGVHEQRRKSAHGFHTPWPDQIYCNERKKKKKKKRKEKKKKKKGGQGEHQIFSARLSSP